MFIKKRLNANVFRLIIKFYLKFILFKNKNQKKLDKHKNLCYYNNINFNKD